VPVPVETELSLAVDERLMEVRRRIFSHEANPFLERSVPGDIRVGPERDLAVTALLSMLSRRVEEFPPEPPTGVLRTYRKLFKVAHGVHLEHMGETSDGPVLRLDDEQEAGLRHAFILLKGGAGHCSGSSRSVRSRSASLSICSIRSASAGWMKRMRASIGSA
jgi:hypothetical protein